MSGAKPQAKPFPVLNTDRLRLRRFATRDVDEVHAAFGNAKTMRYWNSPPSKTRAETARLVRLMAKADGPQWWLPWAIARRRDDRCVGMINYHHREAATAVIRYCFDQLDTHRIEAMIVPENTVSIRLAESLGFRFEGGPIRDRWRAGGKYHSVLMYGLLAGEEA